MRWRVTCRREPRAEQGVARLLGGLFPGKVSAEAAQQDLIGGGEHVFYALLQRRGARSGELLR